MTGPAAIGRGALAAAALVLAPAALLSAAAPVGRAPVHHAIGTFAVTMTPEPASAAPAGERPVARFALTKTFTGALTGTARGTMISVGSPTPGQAAAYVAVDQFAGSVDGRQGGFVLLHRGTIDARNHSELSVTVAPDSGTGALAGIAGTLYIEVKDGQHRYDFAYTLPA